MGAYRVSATRAVRDFSELLRRSGDGGQEILIERHRKPVARLTPAGLSPVRWIDFVRQVCRQRAPDTGFFADLLSARGRRPRRPSESALVVPRTEGTVLLDSSMLLEVNRQRHALHNLQRVATSSAAIAELVSLVSLHGGVIEAVRRAYIVRLASALPVVSMDQSAALQLGCASPPSAVGVLFDLSLATARSLDWPLVGQKEKPPG